MGCLSRITSSRIFGRWCSRCIKFTPLLLPKNASVTCRFNCQIAWLSSVGKVITLSHYYSLIMPFFNIFKKKLLQRYGTFPVQYPLHYLLLLLFHKFVMISCSTCEYFSKLIQIKVFQFILVIIWSIFLFFRSTFRGLHILVFVLE